jgi:hypothetical protein
MEPLSSIAIAVGALLALVTATINLVTAIRSRPGHSSDRDQ